jgi:hypothetical protein
VQRSVCTKTVEHTVMTNGITNGDEGQISDVSSENDVQIIKALEPENTTLAIQEPDHSVRDFLVFLKKEFEPHELKFQALLNQDSIRFEYFWRLFPVGNDITFQHTETGLICAGKVDTPTNECSNRLCPQPINIPTDITNKMSSPLELGSSITTARAFIMSRK